jgi:hypothetical protein
MKNGMHDKDWMSRVTVPVRRVGSQWKFYYGGDVPVRDGAIADLVIAASQITDQSFLKILGAETVTRIFFEGTPLAVALSDQDAWRPDSGRQSWPDVYLNSVPTGTTRFEYVVIGPPKRENLRQQDLIEKGPGGGLWLRLKGLERSTLECSTILLPDGLPQATAVSLNHAFTLLSQQYEQHRISHTGNVYSRVFYQENDGQWHPLSDLRDGVRLRASRSVISSVWDQVEKEQGWCRLPPEPKQTAGRGRSGWHNEED